MPLADASPVDEYLAAIFALDLDDLWAPGVHVTAHVAPWLVGWSGVVAFSRGRRTLVSVPPELVLVSEGLRRLISTGEGDQLARPLRQVYGDEVHGDEAAVLGPSRWGFADSISNVDPPASGAAADTAAADELEVLASAVGGSEWSEGGFDREPARLFAVRDGDGTIAAAANLTRWRASADDVGVCVHPRRRGQGFGRVAAHHAMRAAIEDHGIGRYRALLSNTGSLRIADRIGVVGYGVAYSVVPAGCDVVLSAR